MAYDNFLTDKRIVERNIAKGLVDPDEYKRMTEALPDRESNCVHVSLDSESSSSGASASSSVDDDLDDDDLDDEEDDEDEDEDDDEEEGDDKPA